MPSGIVLTVDEAYDATACRALLDERVPKPMRPIAHASYDARTVRSNVGA